MNPLPLLFAIPGLLKRIPWQVWAALGALALGWGSYVAHGHAVTSAYQTAYNQGVADAKHDVELAQAEADRLAAVGVVVTVKKQQAISTETSNALQANYSSIDARARAIELRHREAEARHQGQPSDPRAAGTAAGEPCPAPAEDGLPWGAAYPLMVQAEKNQAQLNAILDFEEAQQLLAASEEPIK